MIVNVIRRWRAHSSEEAACPARIGRICEQTTGDGGTDEQHRHEQQTAAQEHRREEAILPVTDIVSDDPDEPEERDPCEGNEIQRDDDRPLSAVIDEPRLTVRTS